MISTIRRHRRASLLALLLLLGTAGAAYAYWTTQGSGSGSAATGDATTVVVKQTSTISNLRPGGPAQTLSGNFDNTTNNGPVYITSVTASIAGVDKAQGAPSGTCDATDYTLANATTAVNAEIPAGTGVGSWSGPTLAFNNKATNQDACKNATVRISYAAS